MRCKQRSSLGDDQLMLFMAATQIASEPLDHLLMRLQKESEQGNILLALLHNHSNPFREAQCFPQNFCQTSELPP